MRKSLPILLVAGCVALVAATADVRAADLGELLGAQTHVASAAVETPRTRAVEFKSVDSDRRATSKHPLLRRLIRFYILWVVKPWEN